MTSVTLHRECQGLTENTQDFNLWVPTPNPALNSNKQHYMVLQVRHYFQHFTYIILFNLANNFIRQVQILLPFYI